MEIHSSEPCAYSFEHPSLSSALRAFQGHATEFGAFQQSWRDSSGARMTEFGRYVAVLIKQEDDSWRMDRFFGFSDSTRSSPVRP